MPIPDFQTIMLPLIKISSKAEINLAQAVDQIAEEFNLTEEECSELLTSGKQSVLKNRVAWAKQYLVKAGVLEMTRRAHFRLSERGTEILKENPERVDIKYLCRFEEFKDFYGRKNDESQIGNTQHKKGLTPEEIIHNSLESIENELCNELLSRILSQPPYFFENLIVKLLVEMGYGGSNEDAGKALGKSGDGGVDGVIDQDVLGLDRIYVQAKRYAKGSNVGSGAIRDFFGSLDRYKANKGLFVTTSDFTNDAKETANQLSKRLVLINGWQLVKLMVRYSIGCRVEETLQIKKLDEDFFE